MLIFKKKQSGFTLLELIVTITAASILGITIFEALGSSFMNSSDPLNKLKLQLGLQQAMENINEDYKRTYTTNLNGLKDAIGAGGSGIYGEYNVIENKFIKFNISGGGSTFNEEAAGVGDQKDLLKVTIQNKSADTNETLTNLFIDLIPIP